MPRFLRPWLPFLLALALATSAVQAQTPPQSAAAGVEAAPARALEVARAQLDGIVASLRRENLDDNTLQDLRGRIDPIQASLQELIARETPRRDAIKARLDQLGPKPNDKKSDDKAAAEAPSVTAEREQQQSALNEVDDIVKRARLLAVQAGQISDGVTSRRRNAFLKDLFERTRGIFSPSLWRDVARDLPREAEAIGQVGRDFLSRAGSNLEGWRLPAFLSLLLALVAVTFPLARILHGVLAREPDVSDPTPLRKVLGACWFALVVAALPVALVSVLALLGDAFDLVSDRLMPLARVLGSSVMQVALMAALARAVLAPDRPAWRLVSIPDAAAGRLNRLLLTLAVLAAIMRVTAVLHDLIVSAVSATVLARGLGAFVVAALVVASLYNLPAEAADENAGGGEGGVHVERRRDWFGLVRLGGWLVALVILAAVATGYVSFGAFLADQLVWVLVVSLGAFLLLRLSVHAVEAQCRPGSLLGRVLVRSVGLRHERLGQIGVLLSGALRLVVYVVAALLIVTPWGIQSDDFAGTLRAAYFGFTLGGVTLSPSNLVTALVLFGLGIAATKALQSWLEGRFLPTTTLDAGLRNSISTVTGYAGFLIATALALAHLGLGFEKLAIVAGALSVGIGFGLQSVVNNFVSGLIILWERAIRVGDWIVVGADQGYVRKISVRSTEIETFDRAVMIVPNANLVTGVVKNWVRDDRIGRVTVPITVQNGSNPDLVRDTLIALAREQEGVARIPAPQVLFTELQPSGLTFELICFVADVEAANRAKSDLRFAIFRRFHEVGIHISPSAPGPTVVALAPETQDRLLQTIQKAAE